METGTFHGVKILGKRVDRMKGFIGVTDNDWFAFLSQQPGIDEVNFWQPGGSRVFQSLKSGDPFFFKLHSPHNFIAGGGFFAHSTILPISLEVRKIDPEKGLRTALLASE